MRAINLLLYSGLTTTIASFFLPLAETCIYGPNDEFESYSIYGFEMFIYYVDLVLLIIILGIGFWGNGIIAKIFIYLLFVAGFLVTGFILLVSTAGWGLPCGKSPTFFQYILILGQISVTASSLTRIYHKETGKPKTDNNSILDDNLT